MALCGITITSPTYYCKPKYFLYTLLGESNRWWIELGDGNCKSKDLARSTYISPTMTYLDWIWLFKIEGGKQTTMDVIGLSVKYFDNKSLEVVYITGFNYIKRKLKSFKKGLVKNTNLPNHTCNHVLSLVSLICT